MTWVKINYHSGEAIYKQIKETIKNDIFTGALEANAALPSIRELAKDLNVNPNTVVRAYRELENEGFLYSRPGIGIFVHGQSRQHLEGQARDIVYRETVNTVALAYKYRLTRETVLELLQLAVEEIYGGDQSGRYRD